MKTLIIGGGLSGLFCAILAKQKNIDISIIEHNKELGKKILATGNGRCNFTNRIQSIDKYYNNERVFEIICENSFEKSISFFKSLGIEEFDKDSYIYPYSMQASQVRDSLELMLKYLNIKIYLESIIVKIDKIGNAYEIILENGKKMIFDNIIFASGAKAFPSSGSDGSILKILDRLKIKYNYFLPSLCPIYCKEKGFLKIAAGTRAMANVSVLIDKNPVLSDYGQVQILPDSLSGIPIFQLSPIINKAFYQKKEISIIIDFLPNISDKLNFLKNRLNLRQLKTVKNLLLGVINDRLALAIYKRARIKENTPIENLNEKDLEVLANILGKSLFNVEKISDFNKAQACSGGISLSDLNDRLEHKKYKNMYFIGEIIDVNAMCGGYNFQWAFSSAALVAKSLENQGNLER